MASNSLAGKRVAIYARYSSSLQKETSIEDQVRRCRTFAEQEGGQVCDDLVFTDYATSGTTLHRRGLTALMSQVDSPGNSIDAIVVEDLSRLARNAGDSAKLLEQLAFRRIDLISLADGVRSGDRSSKLVFGVKSLLSDLYIDDLRDKTLRGLQGRALKGYSTGGLPFGYRSRPDASPDGRSLGSVIVVEAAEADIIRWVFDEYCAGRTPRDIARTLTERGIRPPRAHTRHRKVGWIASTIREMLRNAAYTGKWTYGRKVWRKDPATGRRRYLKRDESEVIVDERPHLRIIPEEVWRATVRRIAAQRPGVSGLQRRSLVYPFSGLLFCGSCGDRMVIAGGARRRYRCGNRHKRGLCKNGLSVREETVRTGLFAALRSQLESSEVLEFARTRFAELVGEVLRSENGEVDAITQRIQRNEGRIIRLVEELADGRGSPAIRRALADLEAHLLSDRQDLAARLAVSRAPVQLPSPAEIRQLIFDVEAGMQEDPVRGREALAQFFRDGRIVMEPQDDQTYLARTEVLPLALLGAGEPPLRAARRHTDLVARGRYTRCTTSLGIS